MGNTEKRAIWVTIVILILCSAYYMVVVDSNRSDEISVQVDKNNNQDGDFNEAKEVSQRIEKKLAGHYKHFNTLQDSTRLHYKAYDARVDSIDNAFDKMGFKIEQLEETFSIRIDNLKDALESIKEEIGGIERTTNSKFVKLNNAILKIENDIDKIEKKWIEEFGDEEN